MDKKNILVQLNRRSPGIKLHSDGSVEVLRQKVRKPKKVKKTRIVNRGFTKPSRKANIFDKIHDNRRLIGLVALGIAIIMLLIAIIVNLIETNRPYAIEVAGEEICYVKGNDRAEKVMYKLLRSYIPEGSTIVAVDSGQMIKVDEADSYLVSLGQVVGVKKAVEMIQTKLAENIDADIQITIASKKTAVEDYLPEPNYVKDEDMLAGESKRIDNGKKGSAEVTRRYYTVNGYVVGSEIVSQKILDAGEPATIKKGIIGLPEGEDWKTFDGDPEFTDGTALATLSLHYLGAPYKYGGYSLTKGIDCVQFVRQMYKKYGIDLPNGHKGIQKSGVAVSLKNAQKGDIVCYNHHMGIYIGDGKIVNAIRKGVSVSSVTSRKIVTIRRVVK